MAEENLQKYLKQNIARAAPILPAKFLEKYNDKSKEQNAGKISEILEKWMLKDWNLVYLGWQKSKYSKRTATNSIRSIYAPRKHTKKSGYPKERSRCYKILLQNSHTCLNVSDSAINICKYSENVEKMGKK